MLRSDFLRSVLAEPDSPTPRLIWADYLEEQGDVATANRLRRFTPYLLGRLKRGTDPCPCQPRWMLCLFALRVARHANVRKTLAAEHIAVATQIELFACGIKHLGWGWPKGMPELFRDAVNCALARFSIWQEDISNRAHSDHQVPLSFAYHAGHTLANC